MNINDYLFDELLNKIFTDLSCKCRIQCQLVCQRWLHLLRTSAKFSKDRQLCFNKCVIDDNLYPANVFLDSPIKYNALRFGIECFWSDNVSRFTERFENVAHLDISMVNYMNSLPFEYAQFIGKLKNLKTLVMSNIDTCTKLRRCNLMQALQNLEELRVETVFTKKLPEFTETIRLLPKLKKLYFTDFLDMSVANFMTFMCQYERIIKGMHFNWDLIQCETLQQKILSIFRDSKELQLEQFSFHSSNFQYQLLYQVCQSQKYLSKISVSCTSPIISQYQEKITNMSFRVQRCITNFAFLKPFKNLTSLLVRMTYSHPNGCFFGHSLIENKNLKEFSIYFANQSEVCNACYETMAKSFSNLENFEIHGDSISNEILGIITKNMQKLKKIKILHHEEIPALNCPFEHVVAHEPNLLESITINHLSIISKSDVRSLSTKFPNLKHLDITIASTLYYKDEVTLEKIFIELLKRLSELRSLKFYAFSYKIDHFASDSLINVIINHAKNLKNLSVPFMKVTIEQSFRMFDQMPHLYKISSDLPSVTRADYYETEISKTKSLADLKQGPDQGGWKRFAVTKLEL